MEHRGLLLSALGVGVGLGLGLRLASEQSSLVKRIGSSPDLDGSLVHQIEYELIKQLIDGRRSNLTFDDFPYYISEQTRVLLTSAAFAYLKHTEVYKFTRNLGPASRAVLLSGPTEIYLQMLAKALAHYFEAELLLLDVLDFSVDIQNKYGYSKKERGPVIRSSISGATLEKLYSMFGSLSSQPPKHDNQGKSSRQTSSTDLNSWKEVVNNTINLRQNGSASLDMSTREPQLIPPITASNKCTPAWAFDEKLFLQALYKVLVSVSDRSPVILYIRDVEGLFLQSDRLHYLFTELLKKLTGSVFVLGSRILDPYCDYSDVNEKITLLFPYNIEIRPPEDENQLRKWDTQLEEDMKVIQFQDNKNHITEVLSANDLVCDDLGSICYADELLLGKHMEEIVVSAVYYHLMNHKEAEYRCGKLVLSSASLSHGLHIFQEGKVGRDKASHEINAEARKDTGKSITSAAKLEPKPDATANKCDAKKDNGTTPPAQKADNEFEKRIRAEVIPADEIGVNFQDIGALDEVKESLQELVLLPLRRPDLFKGGLLKPCRGILLFGPPGTGKTMLAKAIASEAGASFINVSISTITSKWFGEDEKNVRALFTLAAKVSPTIIFVDEVDSMLGQRTTDGEHEAMRKIKNEFMTRWDGLMTKPAEQVLVLAATNRPFDLDDAIIRRFERRVMVGLPSAENREMILRTLVSKEKTDELDFKQLATITEGYSGSDLKNLCITAAYRPVRELIQKEREISVETKSNVSDSQNSFVSELKGEEVITPRALNMEDMKWAKSQVGASFAMEGAAMEELRQWNRVYGEGGSRKKEHLTYFL